MHALVLALWSLTMAHGMTIHVIHVSGKRMIALGMDGCSRGSLIERVMTRCDMLSFVDLSPTAIEHHPPLLDWVCFWTEQPKLEAPHTGGVVQGGSWHHRGDFRQPVWILVHGPKNQLFLWSPQPPVPVADAALEELLKAWHKCTDTFHVVLIPRLSAPRGQQLFNSLSAKSVLVGEKLVATYSIST